MSKAKRRRWLPLFVDFDGKPCLVVGGGVVATRKAQRLLAAGAQLTVVAPTLCSGMMKLVASGNITYHSRFYHAADLEGYKLIVAATDDEALNTTIAEAARAKDILVNVAVPGHLSTATLPAAINRPPMQIAISSGGASPALVRRLNRHVASLVPEAYGELADLLDDFRSEIGANFPNVDDRRRFYDAIVDGSVTEQIFAGKPTLARQTLQSVIRQGLPVTTGEVFLVGAGPGDPELLTMRAVRLMQTADVVVYDRLISPTILNLVRADAQRYYVGKARDNHARTQEEINRLLIEHAKTGKRVLRLKGGDPFVFGRGGEEVETLMAAGVPFQVVPGITAATGCAAYVGIPLTHRDMAHTCVFLTGHFSNNETHIDWRALAQPKQTLVFYMGVHNRQEICNRLLEHGMSAETPTAMVQNGTLPDQRVIVCALGKLSQQFAIDSSAPGLIIVGETVKLSPYYHAASIPHAPSVASPPTFSCADRESLYRIICARRDMRHFVAETQIDEETLGRILSAAHRAPSVGLMQPWRFVRIRDETLRARVAELVAAERDATAAVLGERAAEFLRLKVEGIRECAELLVAALAPDDGTVFGRRTMPEEMALCSVACAIQNVWLAARAENLGLGWVSMFDPIALAQLLQIPANGKPVAILCLGPVNEFYSAPMLEQENWRQGRPLNEQVFHDSWDNLPTPRQGSGGTNSP